MPSSKVFRLLRCVCFLAAAGLACPSPVRALIPQDFAVLITAQTQAWPPRIILQWQPVDAAASYRISRKTKESSQWGSYLAVLDGNATSYTDLNVATASAYEYQIEAVTSYQPWPGQPHIAYGYIFAGLDLPLVDQRGRLILVVDQTHAAALSSELSRLESDLVGDGWVVLRHDVARSTPVPQVRDLIRSSYSEDPANTKAVLLFGHVPVPYSGDISPDLHDNHRGAWPADLYYGEVDSTWTDSIVNSTGAQYPENRNLPGDGKFDQSQIPSPIELQVGRVDLFDMPAFLPKTEQDLLRQYLLKDHRYRHNQLGIPRQGLIRDQFGEIAGDAPAATAWRSFVPFFGPANVREIGDGEYFPVLNSTGYLWSYAGGGGDYNHADGVGYTADFAANNVRTVFTILHGSYFGDWDNVDNLSRAPLATPDYGLVCAWSGLPHWFLHHMALGETIGYSTRLTQNNLENGLYRNQVNLSSGLVHVALMGDPTLRLHTVSPVSSLDASRAGAVTLTWVAPSESLVGYHVYRAGTPSGPFSRLTSIPVSESRFVDTSPPAGTPTYMVRVIKLESTPSGAYYNSSQGIFVTASADQNPQLPVVTLNIVDGAASEVNLDTAQFTLVRTGSTPSSLPIHLQFGGAAQNGADYESIPEWLTIPAGSASLAVTLQPKADETIETDEPVSVTLISDAAYQLGSPSAGSIVLRNNSRPTLSGLNDTSITQATSITLSFSIGDNETPPDNLSVSASSADTALILNSGLELSGSGSARTLRISPVPDRTGTAKITVLVDDGSLQATAAFLLTVTAANRPPVAQSASLVTPEDVPVAIRLTGSDPDGNALQFRVVTQPTLGQLAGQAPDLTYTPNLNASGSDQFTFVAHDGALDSAAAPISISITPVNDTPVPVNDSVVTTRNQSLHFAASALLANDADPDPNDPLRVSAVSSATPGATAVLSDGSITYIPPVDFQGADQFEYIVTDAAGATARALVTVQINAPPGGRFIAVTVNTNGDVQLQFEGTPQRAYRLEGCPDFTTWMPLGETTAAADGTAGWMEKAPNGRVRFYRAVLLP